MDALFESRSIVQHTLKTDFLCFTSNGAPDQETTESLATLWQTNRMKDNVIEINFAPLTPIYLINDGVRATRLVHNSECGSTIKFCKVFPSIGKAYIILHADALATIRTCPHQNQVPDAVQNKFTLLDERSDELDGSLSETEEYNVASQTGNSPNDSEEHTPVNEVPRDIEDAGAAQEVEDPDYRPLNERTSSPGACTSPVAMTRPSQRPLPAPAFQADNASQVSFRPPSGTANTFDMLRVPAKRVAESQSAPRAEAIAPNTNSVLAVGSLSNNQDDRPPKRHKVQQQAHNELPASESPMCWIGEDKSIGVYKVRYKSPCLDSRVKGTFKATFLDLGFDLEDETPTIKAPTALGKFLLKHPFTLSCYGWRTHINYTLASVINSELYLIFTKDPNETPIGLTVEFYNKHICTHIRDASLKNLNTPQARFIQIFAKQYKALKEPAPGKIGRILNFPDLPKIDEDGEGVMYVLSPASKSSRSGISYTPLPSFHQWVEARHLFTCDV